ncbi:hypothetical protein [Nocardia farcinica]|uniref:hypothetical protein n=1 Tax=Nocardia farcinica TaxID=37329 RepID=UPI00344170BD
MADKYIRQVAGTLTEIEATVTSAGAANAGDIPALDPTGRLDPSVMPVGIGADTALIQASEALAAGDYVNIHNAGGARVRKADAAAAGKQAHGFVLASVASGANATVYFEGPNTQVTGQTPGEIFLSTTPGVGTSTPPSGSGNVVQRLGVATSPTSVNFEAAQPIVLA